MAYYGYWTCPDCNELQSINLDRVREFNNCVYSVQCYDRQCVRNSKHHYHLWGNSYLGPDSNNYTYTEQNFYSGFGDTVQGRENFPFIGITYECPSCGQTVEEYVRGFSWDNQILDSYCDTNYEDIQIPMADISLISLTEPVPEPTPEPTPTPEPVVSDYSDILDKIDEVNKNVSDFKNKFVSFSDDFDNVDNVETVSLSVNNIMTTPVQDYNLSESLLLVISLSLFVAGLIHIIRRSLPQWH